MFAGKSSKQQKVTAPKIETKVETKVELEKTSVPVLTKDDGALVAVITAAVAAYMAESGETVPEGGFRVVSFTRVRGGKPWNSK